MERSKGRFIRKSLVAGGLTIAAIDLAFNLQSIHTDVTSLNFLHAGFPTYVELGALTVVLGSHAAEQVAVKREQSKPRWRRSEWFAPDGTDLFELHRRIQKYMRDPHLRGPILV